MLKNVLTRLHRFAKQWQEPLFWLPAIFGLLVILQQVIPRLDPRSGIDGLGAVADMVVVAFGVMCAAFFAWVVRMLYGYEPRDKDDRELIDHAAGILRSITPDAAGNRENVGHTMQSWPAAFIYATQRFEWLATFWLLLRCFVPAP